MMPAAKHGDPQMGVDIHLCVVPPSPSPVPLPTPHMSIVFDPFDYVPYLGATVTVCGMKRATAGTNATVVHIPPGFPFAPKLPDKDDELFMGSSTVVADGDPMSHISHPVLGCQVAGLISPPRLKKKNKGMMLLPTTFNLAIPATVFVGGPPTISLMGMAFKGLFAALGKFAKSGLFRRMRQRLFGHLNPGFLKCTILRAEPVNILNGEVSVEQEDFNLPGRIPIEWIRTYGSSNGHTGWCGHGWETLLDIRLEVDSENGNVWMLGPRVGPLCFERIPVAKGEEGSELELSDGARLSDHGDEYRVITKDDRIYHFSKRRAVTGSPEAGPWAIGRIADRCGNGLDFEYSAGHPVAINESAGRRLTLTIEHSRLTSVTLQDHLTGTEHTFVRYEYDAAGDLVAVIDALDAPYRFAYDAHHMVRHTDRNCLSFYYEYDKQHVEEWRVNHAWGDGGLYNYHFEYLDAVNERRITDSLGNVSIIKLDERGLPISEIDPLGGMTIYEYDDVGRTIAVVDPGGHRTAYEYDERGNLLKLTRPDGKCLETKFDAADKAVAVTDPNGALWRQKWKGHGLLVEQITPLGNVSRYEYDGYGQLVAFINPRGARTELGFDSVGNLITLKDALGYCTRYSHDPLGNVISKLDPLDHEMLYHFDAKSRLTVAKLPSGASIHCSYDAEDNLIRYIDENGAKTHLEYFGQGEIARRIQPDGHVVDYLYDTEERLIGVRNQRGEAYQIKRDAVGRITEEVDYWGQSRHYTYDACGYLQASLDPLNRRIDYALDPLGRIIKKQLPEGSVEEFSYDANGNLTCMKNTHIEVTRVFDVEGQLLQETQGEGFTIENTYDASGNRTGRKSSLGNNVEYEFDALNRVSSVRIKGFEPIRIKRDAVGQTSSVELTPGLTHSLNYDIDGLLTGQSIASKKSLLFAALYHYDRTGNLTQCSDSQYGSDTYRYDPLGHILEHVDPQSRLTQYLNDSTGDRLLMRTVEHTHDIEAQARKTKDMWRRKGEYEGTQYRFDRAGNLVERCDCERKTQLIWDANQWLIESCTNGVTTLYGYDPVGRRLFKKTDNICTRFFWDGDVLVGEQTTPITSESPIIDTIKAGTEKKFDFSKLYGPLTRLQTIPPNEHSEYVYYPGTWEPLAVIKDSIAVGKEKAASTPRRIYYYHNNPNGCPNRLLDLEGNTVWAAKYSGWGKVVQLHVNEIENYLRLQGQYQDAETGLYYNRYRYYDSFAGQFASQDRLRLIAGPNTYRFAPNVLGWIDPLGLVCLDRRVGRFRDPHTGQFVAGQRVRGHFPNQVMPGQRVLYRADPVTGAVTHFQHYDAAGLPLKRVDITGATHGGVPTPHVVEFAHNVGPGGQIFPRPNRMVRPAGPQDLL